MVLKESRWPSTQLKGFGLATDAPERVGNRFTFSRWKPPLFPTLKTFRIEETSAHQGRRNKNLKFNHILRSHGTEHVSMRKCSWTWILVSLESAEDCGYKQSGTTKGEGENDRHISESSRSSGRRVVLRIFLHPMVFHHTLHPPRVISCHVYSYVFV